MCCRHGLREAHVLAPELRQELRLEAEQPDVHEHGRQERQAPDPVLVAHQRAQEAMTHKLIVADLLRDERREAPQEERGPRPLQLLVPDALVDEARDLGLEALLAAQLLADGGQAEAQGQGFSVLGHLHEAAALPALLEGLRARGELAPERGRAAGVREVGEHGVAEEVLVLDVLLVQLLLPHCHLVCLLPGLQETLVALL
mmetsp:Transcript_3312/g.9863  ORF Transcript_3312/g.9863 Transcript_3312/m.9863 type:complete len:201 (-) Transcript_3312:390-992(-)